MHNPRTELGCLTALVQTFGGLLALRQPPAIPMSDARRRAWRIGAGAVSILSLAAGAYFTMFTFSEADPWAKMVTAALTFGLFGLPTSFAALFLAGVIAKFAIGAGDTANTLAAVVLAAAFFAQWQFIAWSMFQRTRRPR